VVVVLHGALDVHSAPEVRGRLREVLGQHLDEIIIDLHQVDFMDSTGLGVLIGVRRSAQDADTRLVLARPSRATHRLLVMTGMRRFFKISRTFRPPTGTAA
jgi:anti-sigma B factor antagonist